MSNRGGIPVIDLFAGPGGLCEGFTSILGPKGNRVFNVNVSIEKDPVAHKTLHLRALFRSFKSGNAPDAYYDYIRGDITREELHHHPLAKDNVAQASKEARCAELGKDDHRTIDRWIREGIDRTSEWVLIGGPPCQAYSLAGRSRMRGKDPVAFENDKRHFLYTEYLRIIQKFRPAVFVMENVKGILTSKHSGSHIFDRILADLQEPGKDLSYSIRSLVVPGEITDPWDYVIESEQYGIPQSRHRVILFGIRSDLAKSARVLVQRPDKLILEPYGGQISVEKALDGLPPLRSQITKRLDAVPDSHEEWLKTLNETTRKLRNWKTPDMTSFERAVSHACEMARFHRSTGGNFIEQERLNFSCMPQHLQHWFNDPRLGGTIQHETRRHMRSDLQRYLFASCFARVYRRTPKIKDFPSGLLPEHENVEDDHVPFADRFRVQLLNDPSTTVVSHIAKDGHYYIHPDPSQCRSMTVREAARLQTFPDNYFFEGNRTQQYTQVGNAVPPLLARQIAQVVLRFLKSAKQ